VAIAKFYHCNSASQCYSHHLNSHQVKTSEMPYQKSNSTLNYLNSVELCST